MRKDMKKVLVLTGRHGGGPGDSKILRGKEKTRDKDFESAPKKEGMRQRATKAAGYDRKTPDEYLNPLKRFLEKSVGRPWNKVYSEICENMDKRKATGLHIFQHLYDMIETKAYKDPEDGKYYVDGHFWHGRHEVHPGELFVNEAGIIQRKKGKRSDRWNRGKPEPTIEKVQIDQHSFYIKWENIWYNVTFKEVPRYPGMYLARRYGAALSDEAFEKEREKRRRTYYDVLLRKEINPSNTFYKLEEMYGKVAMRDDQDYVRIAIHKQQVSKADKKRHGLV